VPSGDRADTIREEEYQNLPAIHVAVGVGVVRCVAAALLQHRVQVHELADAGAMRGRRGGHRRDRDETHHVSLKTLEDMVYWCAAAKAKITRNLLDKMPSQGP
jgi:hypothetical protein